MHRSGVEEVSDYFIYSDYIYSVQSEIEEYISSYSKNANDEVESFNAEYIAAYDGLIKMNVNAQQIELELLRSLIDTNATIDFTSFDLSSVDNPDYVGINNISLPETIEEGKTYDCSFSIKNFGAIADTNFSLLLAESEGLSLAIDSVLID